MISMAQQQQALQRQNAIAEQNLRIQQAQEQRAVAEEGQKVSKGDVELAAARLALYRDQAVQVRSPEGYANWLTGVKKDSPEIARAFQTNLPFEQFTPEKLQFMIGSAEQVFNARYPKAVASTQISPEGGLMTSVASGIPGASYSVPQPDISQPLNRAAPTAPPTTPSNVPQPPVSPNVPARATRGYATTPQDLLRQGVDPNSIPSGNPLQPMSAVNNGADLQGIVQNMMQTGVVSQSDFAVLQQTAGPEKAGELAQVLRANNISIMPSESMGGMRSAVYRPDQDGMPFQRAIQGGETPTMQQVQYDPSAYRQAQAKSPMQSPMPGSAIVPLPRVRGEAAAEEGGQQGVRVVTQPKIVAGEERAKRLEKLRGDLPQARSEAQAVVDNLASRINAIDEFLSSKYRWSVIGPIEGNLPRIMQSGPRADMQRLWDTITNNDVLQTVLTARAQTSTGGSPLGNLSNSDLKFIVGASTPLTQTGEPEVQDQRMFKLRRALVEKLNTQKQTFDDTFREVSAETPNIRLRIPTISPTFRPKTAASGGGLRTGDPEMDAIMRKHGRK
jgi:hypothetical protein